MTTENDGWTLVADEEPSTFIFDTPGDTLIGKYAGFEDIENGEESFRQYRFRAMIDGSETYLAVNGGYKITQAMEKVPVGDWVKIVYVKNVDVGSPSPMKDYIVYSRHE